MSDHGVLLFKRTRTISMRNWPFLVLLSVIAAIAGLPFSLEGNLKLELLIVAAVWAVPAMIFLLEFFVGYQLDELRERGVIWRRAWQYGFIEWARLRYETRHTTVDGESHTTEWLIDVDGFTMRVDGLTPEAREIMKRALPPRP